MAWWSAVEHADGNNMFLKAVVAFYLETDGWYCLKSSDQDISDLMPSSFFLCGGDDGLWDAEERLHQFLLASLVHTVYLQQMCRWQHILNTELIKLGDLGPHTSQPQFLQVGHNVLSSSDLDTVLSPHSTDCTHLSVATSEPNTTVGFWSGLAGPDLQWCWQSLPTHRVPRE